MDTSSASPKKPNQRTLSYLLLATGCVLLVTAFLIGISNNMPGIVSMLAGFLAVVLGIVYRFAKSGKRNPSLQLLYWAPRALCIVIAVFISMFALDVFGGGKGFLETTLALLIHLIPTYVILILLAVSWRRVWIGGVCRDNLFMRPVFMETG
jgi:small-conductance mechanosensitive channel